MKPLSKKARLMVPSELVKLRSAMNGCPMSVIIPPIYEML